MVYNLTDDVRYFVDRGMYEQKMAIENIIFVLSKHIDDNNADFLNSPLFERLHDKVVEKSIERWYRENEIIHQFTNGAISYYSFDLAQGILNLEMR